MNIYRRLAVVAVTAACLAAPAHAGYFVRPVLQFLPGQTIDGLTANGATYKEVSFTDTARSGFASVDLATGELKATTYASGGTQGTYANVIFGDTVTIQGGAGTTWDFGLALDGFYELGITAPVPAPPTAASLVYDLAFAVYRVGETNSNSWVADSANAEFFQVKQNYSVSYDVENPYISIWDEIADSIVLETDFEVFEIYARIFIGGSGSVSDGVSSVLADFSNTGSLSFGFADAVDVYSDSGALLGYGKLPPATDIPTPGSLALLGSGLVASAVFRRRRRSA